MGALTAQPITSPRLRGEVGSRTQRGFRVRGNLSLQLRVRWSRELAPHPHPLPASGRAVRGKFDDHLSESLPAKVPVNDVYLPSPPTGRGERAGGGGPTD